MRESRLIVLQLILLLVGVFIIYLSTVFVPVIWSQVSLPTLQRTELPRPRPTPQSAAIARAPQSFQYLVSIAERGFEPANLTVKIGGTVQFSNTTDDTLQLESESEIFGAVGTVAAGRYREITFRKAGSYQYSDGTAGRTGTIIVQ